MKRTQVLRPHRLRDARVSQHHADPDRTDGDAGAPEPAASAPTAEPAIDPAVDPAVDHIRGRIDEAGGDFVAALTAACETAAEATQAQRATIRLVEGPHLRAWATTATSGREIVKRVPIASSMEGLAVREGQLILCDDAASDERADPDTSLRLDARSWLVLPLAWGDEIVGTLSVSEPEPSAFSTPQHGHELAEVLCGIAGALGAHLQTAAWLLERDRAREETVGQVNETQITAEMMTEGVIVFDRDGRFRRANNAAARLLGLNLEQIAGRHVRDALRTLVREDGTEWPGDEQPPAVTLATGNSSRDVIMGVHRPQGVPRWVSVSSRILPDAHGAPNGVVVVLTDCSERRGLREQLAHATLHDAATGLPNRRLLHLELDETIDRSRRQGLGAALVHVVLPNLADLRTSLGAHGADDVLRTIAQRLVHTVRDGEMVARGGDDEFAAVLGLLGDSERAVEALLQRVRSGLAEPVELGRTSVDVVPQFIVSVFPGDGRTAEALLRHAALERMHGRTIPA
jgi:diguanylate cyclase (GGDEF)-like protein/PAS domain S-box-containing protein